MLGNKPLPFHEAQRRVNDAYYSTRSAEAETPLDRIGFATPSHDPKYVEAHVKEFIEFARKRGGVLKVHEFGAADATFANGFLNYLRDNAPDVYNRVHYHAWDKSKQLLTAARRALSEHSNATISQGDVELSNFKSMHGTADWIFCHELFDDLPTRVVAKKKGEVKEVWLSPTTRGNATILEAQHHPLPDDEHRKRTERFMRKVPESMRTTIPLAGVKALHNIHALLKEGGIVRINDYGIINTGVFPTYAALSLKYPNAQAPYLQILKDGYVVVGAALTQRRAGEGVTAALSSRMQLTTLVNFPYLAEEAKSLGMRVRVEPTTNWVKRNLGQNYSFGAQHFAAASYRFAGEIQTELLPEAEGFLAGHGLFHPKGELRAEVMRIVKKEGDTPKAFMRAVEALNNHGINILVRFAPRKEPGEDYYVLDNLKEIIRNEFMAIHRTVQQKAQVVEGGAHVGNVSYQGETHRKKFEKEASELAELGFNTKDIAWYLFGEPHTHRFSSGLFRISMTAVKKRTTQVARSKR